MMVNLFSDGGNAVSQGEELPPLPLGTPIGKVPAPRGGVLENQYGVALLTVLLVIALASLTAVQLASSQQFSVRRSELLLHRQQAKQYLLGAERWALAILIRDRNANDTDHADEDWATIPPALPVSGGVVSGQLSDLQARFNLNNLLTPEGSIDDRQLQVLSRLLAQLELPEGIAQAVADWLDDDQQIRFPDGAEDSDYLLATPSYLAANRELADPSELRLIKGVDAETYAKLVPFISTLPGHVPININTASPELLAALDPALDSTGAEHLIAERESQAFASVVDFLAATGLEEPQIRHEDIAVGSAYFLLRAQASVGSASAQLSSVLRRDSQGLGVIMRSFGVDS